MIEAIRAAHPGWNSGQGLDFQVHQALGGKGEHVADQIGVSPFSISSISAILSSVIVVSGLRVRCRNPNSNRRPAMTTSSVACSYTTPRDATREPQHT